MKAAAIGAEEWLAALPGMLADLEREWGISIGEALEGGSEAFVAPAVRADGSEAILKVLMPVDPVAAEHEIMALRLAEGRGMARLLESDVARRAMLLERLGPTVASLKLPRKRELELLSDAAREVWRPVEGWRFPTGAEKGRWLISYIEEMWESLGRPCSERAVAYAVGCIERRVAAYDASRAVLVHGDIHTNNALVSGEGCRLIDPDGLLAEPEYDLGVIIREDAINEADPMGLARWLAERTGTDAAATWEWAAGERLSTGLLCVHAGFQPFGDVLVGEAERAAAGSGDPGG